MRDETILSRAHEWVEKLPVQSGNVKCTRCGVVTRIGEWDGPRCEPHAEFATSGYVDESDA